MPTNCLALHYPVGKRFSIRSPALLPCQRLVPMSLEFMGSNSTQGETPCFWLDSNRLIDLGYHYTPSNNMKISLMKCIGLANVIFKAVCRIPRLANSMDQPQGPNSVDVGPKPWSRPNWYHYLKKKLLTGRLHQLSLDPLHACLGRQAQISMELKNPLCPYYTLANFCSFVHHRDER